MQAFAVSVGMCVSLWQRFVDKFMDGSPGGIAPRAPTERSVTVSRHSALLISVCTR